MSRRSTSFAATSTRHASSLGQAALMKLVEIISPRQARVMPDTARVSMPRQLYQAQEPADEVSRTHTGSRRHASLAFRHGSPAARTPRRQMTRLQHDFFPHRPTPRSRSGSQSVSRLGPALTHWLAMQGWTRCSILCAAYRYSTLTIITNAQGSQYFSRDT